VLQLLITTRPDASDPRLAGSPMHEAAWYGHLAAMQLLVQHGADVHNSKGKPWSSGSTQACGTFVPALGAGGSGHLEVIRWLHEQGMTGDEVGKALKAAACRGHAPIIRYLIQECGANVSLYGPDALRRASEAGSPEVVRSLLEAGTPTDVAAYIQAAQQSLRRFNPEHMHDILQAATQHGQHSLRKC
jgi:ankyrin repeat protein